ncbi:MAG: hypothetical protein JWN79_1812 [Gemmatimonadetes bacterium]|jgi:hypothetical protein|nr:hypothetical protein [Gemmatimonadota bacterium]
MPANVAGLRYPYTRVLLPRTRLAYVHLRNLLTDAKRDRAARVSGYVAIWLPEEFVVLYLQHGELVNASLHDGKTFHSLAISAAVEKVPAEPEYGEICFHEADDEQLACMYASQTGAPEPFPPELRASDPAALFPFLMASTWDGLLEIASDRGVNYLVFRNGVVQHAYLSGAAQGTMVERVSALFDVEHRALHLTVRRWAPPGPLPVQAPTGLVQAYRDLATQLVLRLVADGRESAPAIAEHARATLVATHPALDGLSFSGRTPRAVVADAADLTSGIAALVNELLWTATDQEGNGPEQMLRELTHERRHLFQSAGLFDRLAWKLS